MPYKDLEAYRLYQSEYQKQYKREVRAEQRRARSLHQELGIKTYTHLQAVTDYKGGFDRESGQYWSPHHFRARITLARVG